MKSLCKQAAVLAVLGTVQTIVAQTEHYTILFKGDDPVSVSRTNNHGVSAGTSGQFGQIGLFFKEGNYTIFDFPPGTVSASVTGINDAGDIVGTYLSPLSGGGFLRKSNGVYTSLQVPGEGTTLPFAINNRGLVVGYFFPLNPPLSGPLGFIYNNGSYTKFTVPGAIGVQLYDINDMGDVVGKVTTVCNPVCESYPFVYHNGNITPSPSYPGALTTVITGINNRGEMTGYGFFQGARYVGFILRDGQFETLRFPGIARVVPNGINEKGEVTGEYRIVPGLEGTSFIRSPR